MSYDVSLNKLNHNKIKNVLNHDTTVSHQTKPWISQTITPQLTDILPIYCYSLDAVTNNALFTYSDTQPTLSFQALFIPCIRGAVNLYAY